MKNSLRIALLFTVWLIVSTACTAQDFHPLALSISQRIAGSGRKSAAVVDFTNLDGNPTKLGRFLAEEFSGVLFSEATGFDVIDRTHLKAILLEHKLATTGLIDPVTARKLGQIAGVQALVTGTITPFEEHVRLSLKVLDTETAKILAAGTYDVPRTKTIGDLISSEGNSSGGQSPDTRGTANSRPGANDAVLPPGITRDDLVFTTRGCRDKGTTTTCFFSITNRSGITRRVWFTGDFLVDDQGNQYNHVQINFGSKTSWFDNTTDLIPGVSVNLALEVSNLTDSANVINAQLSYGVQGYIGGGLTNATFGRVTITRIPVTRQ
ncbi:MAG: CsgG/HfaB family protein [Acidobacteriia bacterium]|nr:CsgG/HfaB family protein [Terriglobia bacterium]